MSTASGFFGRAVLGLDASETTDMGDMSLAELRVRQAQVQADLAVAEAIGSLGTSLAQRLGPVMTPDYGECPPATGPIDPACCKACAMVTASLHDHARVAPEKGGKVGVVVPDVPDPDYWVLPYTGGSGAREIALERRRQIGKGYTAEHDKQHAVRDFVGAAALLLSARPPFSPAFTCEPADPESVMFERDDLVRAGALIAAAIDRLEVDDD